MSISADMEFFKKEEQNIKDVISLNDTQNILYYVMPSVTNLALFLWSNEKGNVKNELPELISTLLIDIVTLYSSIYQTDFVFAEIGKELILQGSQEINPKDYYENLIIPYHKLRQSIDSIVINENKKPDFKSLIMLFKYLKAIKGE